MKILIGSTPATGHVNPMLAIARILMTDGHEVAVYTGSAFRARVEAARAEFFSLPPDADLDPADPFARVPELKVMSPGPGWLRVAMERVFVDNIPAQHEGLQRLLHSFGPDVIIGDDMFFGVLPMLLGTFEAATHCYVRHLDPALAARRRRPALRRPAAGDNTQTTRRVRSRRTGLSRGR